MPDLPRQEPHADHAALSTLRSSSWGGSWLFEQGFRLVAEPELKPHLGLIALLEAQSLRLQS